jgi:membrane-associated protease RseP (regulator of RpoE activity)
VLIALNGIPISNVQDVRVFSLTPGDIVNVTFIDIDQNVIRSINLTVGEDPDTPGRGILGYIPADYYPPKIEGLSPYLPTVLYEVLFWIFFLSLNIGLVNMLPIYLLDGYGFLDSLLDHFGVKGGKKRTIMYSLTAISLVLLILNLSVHLILRLIT